MGCVLRAACSIGPMLQNVPMKSVKLGNTRRWLPWQLCRHHHPITVICVWWRHWELHHAVGIIVHIHQGDWPSRTHCHRVFASGFLTRTHTHTHQTRIRIRFPSPKTPFSLVCALTQCLWWISPFDTNTQERIMCVSVWLAVCLSARHLAERRHHIKNTLKSNAMAITMRHMELFRFPLLRTGAFDCHRNVRKDSQWFTCASSNYDDKPNSSFDILCLKSRQSNHCSFFSAHFHRPVKLSAMFSINWLQTLRPKSVQNKQNRPNNAPKKRISVTLINWIMLPLPLDHRSSWALTFVFSDSTANWPRSECKPGMQMDCIHNPCVVAANVAAVGWTETENTRCRVINIVFAVFSV